MLATAPDRRTVLQALGALGVSTALSGRGSLSVTAERGYDVVVVGAGVLGIWTAARLQQAGKRVAVLDAVGPAHGRASSGGESRVTRCGYGDQAIYAEWAWRSMSDWRQLSRQAGLPIFHRLGVLWVHQQPDELVEASVPILSRLKIPFELIPAKELRSRYPVMQVGDGEAGLLEPKGGALMAHRAVQVLAAEIAEAGVTFRAGLVEPLRTAQGEKGALPAVTTTAGERIQAEQFVIACGPWLDRVCPDAMAGRLFVTRQEVQFFAVDGGATGHLPVWADLPYYGMPSLEGLGFKVACDTHGPRFDPDTGSRRPTDESEQAARAFLARRFPALAGSPLSGTRVCQYENSSNGHLLIDRHPGLDNVWLVGCGSGHAFKHGPAVAAHVADLVAGRAKPREPFLLASKKVRQERAVQ